MRNENLNSPFRTRKNFSALIANFQHSVLRFRQFVASRTSLESAHPANNYDGSTSWHQRSRTSDISPELWANRIFSFVDNFIISLNNSRTFFFQIQPPSLTSSRLPQVTNNTMPIQRRTGTTWLIITISTCTIHLHMLIRHSTTTAAEIICHLCTTTFTPSSPSPCPTHISITINITASTITITATLSTFTRAITSTTCRYHR